MFNNDWNSSYLLGLDRRQHNGQTYYFTFYSEFGERLAETYIEVGLLVTTLAASVIFNLALVLPLWGSKPRTVTNCFLLNLGLADILFAVGIPAVVTVRINPRWPTFAGELMCKLLPYSQVSRMYMFTFNFYFQFLTTKLDIICNVRPFNSSVFIKKFCN